MAGTQSKIFWVRFLLAVRCVNRTCARQPSPRHNCNINLTSFLGIYKTIAFKCQQDFLSLKANILTLCNHRVTCSKIFRVLENWRLRPASNAYLLSIDIKSMNFLIIQKFVWWTHVSRSSEAEQMPSMKKTLFVSNCEWMKHLHL